MLTSFLGSGIPSSGVLATSSGNGTTITIPVAGRVAGAICFIGNVAVDVPSPPAAPTFSGFTELENEALDVGPVGYRAGLWAKKLTGAETTLTGMSGTTQRWTLLVVQPTVAVASFAWTGDSEMTQNNPGDQTILGSGKSNVIALVHVWGENPTSPTIAGGGFTEIEQASIYSLHFRIYTGAGANVLVGEDDLGDLTALQTGVLDLAA